jgi:hypothetical protein
MNSQPALQMLLRLDEREPKREGEQLRQVRILMQDGNWRTLAGIKSALPQPYLETSISARLRDLRKIGFEVDRRKVGPGLFEYQARRAQ